MSPLYNIAIFFLWAITLLVGTSQAGVIGHYDGKGVESHDFSDDLAKSASAQYESLGSLGDHLDESHFPTDFGESHHQGNEYAEGSEHIEYGAPSSYDHEFHQPQHFEYSEHQFHSGLHDFETKPVPGIDHGKGALSYSTTYEFPKDNKP
ncbi:uncharacterized protein LOC133333963 [Musca vetustissima]|uniref:uncharacterized protein LOC133333963 n=1 Tax=Musca vetustissima TaxID=27455 RepID=UPI002AB634EC|nr:uncharacterized protein LOC133333963 [Musca vetustissima]